MKYLKLFEEHNKYYTNISEEEYFKLVSGEYDPLLNYNGENFSEYANYLINNWVEFTENEIQQISQTLPDHELKYTDFENIPKGEIELSKNEYGMPSASVIIITKLKDEWFIIMDDRSNLDAPYFKCDQMDGLIKYLKNV
jgi:hypothetical protein